MPVRDRLTKRAVEALQPGTIKIGKTAGQKTSAFLWDGDVRGFGVRMAPGGKRVYIYQYRPKNGGPERRHSIGPHGAIWTVDSARKEASRLAREVAQGGDPSRELQDARKAETIIELADRFLEEHVEVRTKPGTAKEYRRLIENFVKPKLGRLKVPDVSRRDVARLHYSRRNTPRDANHLLSVLSKMFNLAERWGLRPDGSNPARNIERFKEVKRNRYLQGKELARLGEALADGGKSQNFSPMSIGLFRLLLLTGARLNELRLLQWDQVSIEDGLITLSDSKTGPKTIRLNAPACQVLTELPRLHGSKIVFPGKSPDRPLANHHHDWHKIRDNAGIPDVRIHDLRHSFASVAVAGGLGLPIIGSLLGHTSAETTNRYAHLADDPLKAAAEMIGSRITDAMEGNKPKQNNVTAISPRKGRRKDPSKK